MKDRHPRLVLIDDFNGALQRGLVDEDIGICQQQAVAAEFSCGVQQPIDLAGGQIMHPGVIQPGEGLEIVRPGGALKARCGRGIGAQQIENLRERPIIRIARHAEDISAVEEVEALEIPDALVLHHRAADAEGMARDMARTAGKRMTIRRFRIDLRE